MKNSKFIEAAQADFESMYTKRLRRGLFMVEHLAELYEALHKLDPENYNINSHWVFAEE